MVSQHATQCVNKQPKDWWASLISFHVTSCLFWREEGIKRQIDSNLLNIPIKFILSFLKLIFEWNMY